MKIAFLTNNLNAAKQCNNADILYFGDEFCQNKIPDTKTVQKAYKWASGNNIQFVFVLPYITNEKIKCVDSVLKYLNALQTKTEVIFNDWGTFTMIASYNRLLPVMGRLLTKQRKDPIAEAVILNKQSKIKVMSENNQKFIVETKKIPKTLKTYFQKSFLDTSYATDFMISNNINRCELDLLPWGNKLNINKKIKQSVYYPFVNISTTRYCGAINLTYTNKCNFICLKQTLEIGKDKLKYPYIINGNAIFYKASEKMLCDALKNKNTDRVVINDSLTLQNLKDKKHI
ncbi:MAG: hypothetical protein WC234_00590 [Endomicrobiaceae bacterium]